MLNLKNNKGITLLAEVMTVAVLMIIISIITYSSMSTIQVKKLNNMYADIVSIQEKAANYYLKYGEAPVDTDSIVSNTSIPETQKNPNDKGHYYKVDLSKLLNLTLNNNESDDGFYFMNETTLTTYYSKGVTIENLNNSGEETYYTIPSNYENVHKIDVEQYQN